MEKHITDLFSLYLALNEANNAYDGLLVTAAVPTTCRNLQILSLFSPHIYFCLDVLKTASLQLPLSQYPHTRPYPKPAFTFDT